MGVCKSDYRYKVGLGRDWPYGSIESGIDDNA